MKAKNADGKLLTRWELADEIETRIGRPVSEATIYFWMRTGLYGVKLGSTRIGNKLFTSWRQYEQFQAAISNHQ